MGKRSVIAIVLSVTVFVIAVVGAYFLVKALLRPYERNYIPIANFQHAQVQYREDTKKVFEMYLRPDTIRHHGDLFIQVGDSEPVRLRDMVEADVPQDCVRLEWADEVAYACSSDRLRFTKGKLESVSLTGAGDIRLGTRKDNLLAIPFSLEHAIDMFGPVSSYDRMKVVAP